MADDEIEIHVKFDCPDEVFVSVGRAEWESLSAWEKSQLVADRTREDVLIRYRRLWDDEEGAVEGDGDSENWEEEEDDV